jgi:hypothetical protein
MNKIIKNSEWDFTISSSAKTLIAIVISLVGGAVWLLYSTPNTIELLLKWTSNTIVFGQEISGSIMGIVLGLAISILELAFICIALWKRGTYLWWALAIICGCFSIAGSVGFQNISNQNASIKYQSLKDTQNLVEQKKESIANEERMLRDYDQQIAICESNFSPVPNWLYRRKRQALERKTQKENELERLTKKLIETRNKTGPIVSTANLENPSITGWDVILASFWEFIIFICTIIAIGINKTNDDLNNDEVLKILAQNHIEQRKSQSDSNNDDGSSKSIYAENVNKIIAQKNKNKQRIGFEIGTGTRSEPEPEPEPDRNRNRIENGTILAKNDIELERKKPERSDENRNQTGTGTGTRSEPEPNKKRNQIDKRTLNKLLLLVQKFGGKSDPVILYFYDRGERNWTRIGRLVGNILNRKPVSRTYVRRVIRRERDD